MIQEIAEALAQSWSNFTGAFVLFVPRLVAATIIFAGGFVVAVLARRIVRNTLVWLQFDRLAARSGASEMLRVAEMPSADLLVAKIVFWIVWMGFVVSAVDALQFGPLQGLVQQFFLFVPRAPSGSAGARPGISRRQLRLAWHAAGVGQCRSAGRPFAQRNAPPPGDRDSGGHGARTAGLGDSRRVDGICHRIRRVDAGVGDSVRPRRPGRCQAAARSASESPAGAGTGCHPSSVNSRREVREHGIESVPILRKWRFPVRAVCSCTRPLCLGDLGLAIWAPTAFEFIEWLAAAGQRLWQVLPLGPTGYGNSPYQSFSAFAGNPLLISLDELIKDGLLTAAACSEEDFAEGDVDFSAVIAHRQRLWPPRAGSLRPGGAPCRARSF